MTTRRRIAGLLTAGVLATTGTIAFALPSNAEDYGGKDPYATNCDQYAEVVRKRPVEAANGPHEGATIGRVRLWWSEHCGTNWTTVRVFNRQSSGYVGVQKRSGFERGHAFDSGKLRYHTRMVNGRDVDVRGKGTVHWDRSSGSARTGWAGG
jgi:Protein of unknown function (DUF2690)